jgi:hypothetical protein
VLTPAAIRHCSIGAVGIEKDGGRSWLFLPLMASGRVIGKVRWSHTSTDLGRLKVLEQTAPEFVPLVPMPTEVAAYGQEHAQEIINTWRAF